MAPLTRSGGSGCRGESQCLNPTEVGKTVAASTRQTECWSFQCNVAPLAGRRVDRRFEPGLDFARREELFEGWKRAVERAKLR